MGASAQPAPEPGVAVIPLLTGRVAIHLLQLRGRGRGRIRLPLTLLDRRWTGWLPVWSWAIRHPAGTIVVDSGISASWRAPWWDAYGRLAVRFRVAAEDDLAARLREHGIDPAGIRWHVFTHLHVDHVGALGCLPSAEVVVSEAAWRAAHSRTGRLRGLIVPREPQRLSLVRFDGPGVGPFGSAHALFADRSVLLLPTPGHSPGHLSVLVQRPADRALISGDAVYSERQLLEGWIDGVALDARAARDSVRRLLELCAVAPTIVLPSHDPEAADRLRKSGAVPVTPMNA